MTTSPPSEIQALIEAHIRGFNSHDDGLFLSVFGETAVIIDGIAPYRWMNPIRLRTPSRIAMASGESRARPGAGPHSRSG